MRQYNIQEIDLGFILKKSYKDEDDTITRVLYWNGKRRDRRRDSAKTYYFRDDAAGGLVYARKFGGNEPC